MPVHFYGSRVDPSAAEGNATTPPMGQTTDSTTLPEMLLRNDTVVGKCGSVLGSYRFSGYRK